VKERAAMMRTIYVNGQKLMVDEKQSYESIVALAEMSGTPSMTLKRGRNGRMWHPGTLEEVLDGDVFNVCHTGNA
jgi:hypothetical protein